MPPESSWFGVGSYVAAALAYGAVTALLLGNNPGGKRAWLLTAATGSSFVWAAIIATLMAAERLSLGVAVALDALHLLVWIVCVLSWLEGFAFGRWVVLIAVAAAGWAIAVVAPPVQPLGLASTAELAVLGMTAAGLLAAEQVSRNAHEGQRRHLRLLCLATGGIFVADLFVYAEAVLLGGFLPWFWEARGLVNAALLPLIVLAVKRQREWERELFVSRQVMFYTASLLAVGAYLLAMGFVAYALRRFDRAWDLPVTLAFMLGAAALLMFIFYSATLRMRFRAFLIKHFYRNKYDYRLEWLRLTQNLGLSTELRVLALNGLETMTQIAGGRRGQLWLSRDFRRYELMASLGSSPATVSPYHSDHPLVRFLTERSWVVDSAEYAAHPDRYGNAFGNPADGLLPSGCVVVPLDFQGGLQGFVILDNPAGAGALNFEDHDILKTAGKQLAVALSQALTLEKLAETRQFEVVNKMSAFLMHDLKNILAQQELVVANAVRFRQRPEFIDDAIATIRAGADRMRNVLEQLDRSRSKPVSVGRVDLSKALMEARSHCADREPIPDVEVSARALWIPMDREKIVGVLTHLIRNAQDATPADGSVRIGAVRAGREVVCTVADTGCGMDPLFVRDRLFRPFDSTKGAAGMGIGVYQARELVRAAGGEVEVSSEPGVGTTFSLLFPAVEDETFSHQQPVAAGSSE